MPDQIALIEVPVRDITDARSLRLVYEIDRLDVLGNRCQVMGAGRHLEFWVGDRHFEVSLEQLVQAAGAAITAHLRSEVASRVLAARREAGAARTPAEPFQ